MTKILALDIESKPNVVHAWDLWNQNISINQLMASQELLCFAAKWFGDEEVFFYSEHQHGKEEMVHAAYDLLTEADWVVHFNGKRYDIPHLNREFLLAGLGPPPPYQQIDLLEAVKKQFRFPSNKLAWVSKALGLEGKIEHEGHDLWVKCMAGDEDAWETMRTYNERDVTLLEDLYERLLPWIPGHPNLAIEAFVCPKCGSDDLAQGGFTTTGLSQFRQFQCMDCGTWAREAKRVRGADLRAVAL